MAKTQNSNHLVHMVRNKKMNNNNLNNVDIQMKP